MPSPIAVEACGRSASIAAVTAPRSRVGGTTVVAVPAKVTSATLNFGGQPVDELHRGALGRVQPVGLDVPGLHG